MSGTLPSLKVDIVAADKTGPVLDRAGRRITQTGQAAERTGKSLARLGETSGITRLSQGFQTLAGSSGDAFRSMAQLSPAMAGITGAASLAGMTTLVTRWAQLGQQVRLTGQRLSLPTDRLTALHGAARLAGASAEAMDAGLTSLDERLRSATFRGDVGAIQTFNALGVSFRTASGQARNAGAALGDVADGIQRLYDGGKGRGAALRAAQNLGLEQLFPLLIQGRAGIARLSAESARLGGVISPEAAKRADALKSSFTGLEIAVEGVARRLGDEWGQAVKPYIDGTANWIANNKKLADSYASIGAAILALGAIRPAAWLARILGIGALATPAALASPLLLSGDTDAGATAAGAPGWAAPGGFLGRGGTVERWWGRNAPTWLGGNPAPRAAGISVPRRGTAAFDVMKQTHDFWRSKGFTEAQTSGILANIAAESSFNPGSVGDGGTSFGLYQHHAARRDALFARYGSQPTVEQQNQFAYDELQEASRRGTLAALRAAPTAGQAAAVFTSGFEMPKDTVQTAMGRARQAEQFNGAVDVNVNIQGAPAGTTARATSSGSVRVPPPRIESALPTH